MPNSATNGLASLMILVIRPASASAEGSSSWKRSAPAAAEAALETGRLTISGDEQTAALV
jgi:hypothetical protein